MSNLTGSITDLVSRTNALLDVFDKKKAEIDAAVKAAIAAVPEHVRTVWLDQAKGDDKNDGLTSAKPVKTLGQALKLGGAGRAVTIRLLSDYTWINRREQLLANQTVYLYGDGKRKFNLPVLPIETTSGDYANAQCEVAGFYQSVPGHNTVVLNNLEVVFPSAPPASSGALSAQTYSALIGSNGTVGGSMLTVEIFYCEIVYPPDGVGVLIGAGMRPISLVVKSATYPAHFAGNWVGGVAAGTAVPVPGKAYIQSNLKTL